MSLPLLPFRWRFAGLGLILAGLIAGYMYYFGSKPAFFEVPVFAIITSYFETRTWVVAQTNLLDEMAAVFILTGLIFLAFSREKNENGEVQMLRLKALIYAAYLTSSLWILSFLLIFGWPIIIASAFIFAVFLLVNLVIFRVMIARKHFRTKSKTK
jgi:hypothetical protein